MERRDLDEIERFLTSVGQPTLFAYYGLDSACAPSVAEDAIKKRRAWAQGQQSNPKYKSEALFLIKNSALLRRVLVEGLDDYRASLQGDTQQRNLETLSLFIRGSLTSGRLTPQIEAAILQQGRQLDLSDGAITRRIEELLLETGATREWFESDELSSSSLAVDHYLILGVDERASASAIEQAYRERYRWARNLKDLRRSAQLLEALDQAWRVLSDDAHRARYDARRAEMRDVTDEVERQTAVLLGQLPGPQEAAPVPQQPLAPPPIRMPTPAPLPVQGASSPVTVAAPASGERAIPTPNVDPSPGPAGEGRPIRLRTRPSGSTLPVAPPPPPVLAGRTVGLSDSPQAIAALRPRLIIEGPEVASARVRRRAVDLAWTIRNGGQGLMPGRISCDREWVRIESPRLNPSVPAQELIATLLPNRMPAGRSVATILVTTDHGERRTLSIHAERRSGAPAVLGLIIGALLLGGGALAWRATSTPEEAGGAVLELTVDPIADSTCCCCLGRVYQRLSSGRGLWGVLAAGLATLVVGLALQRGSDNLAHAAFPKLAPIHVGEQDWPWWRGPSRNGVAPQGPPAPLAWSATENVVWKVEVPGKGHGSPTVVGDR